MRRLLPPGFASLAITVVVVAISASALAFFTPSGAGTASAGVSKLTAPAITTITPAVGGTVSLAWSAATAPGTGSVTYYVTRDGGDPAGTCAAPAVPTAAVSCKDAGVPVGSHTYTVTAVWRSWSVTSGTQTAKITIGAATHLKIEASSETPAVGASTNLAITALDEKEAPVTTYTGSHSLIFAGAASSPGGTAPTVVNSSGTATAFGKATALTFTLGVAAVSASKNGLLKIYKSGPAEIVATEGSITTTSPLDLEMISGAPSKYNLNAATTTPVVGARTDLTITAIDSYGNVAATYAGPHELVFTTALSAVGPNGNLPTVSDSGGVDVAFGTATKIEFVAGVATTAGTANGEMVLYKTGSTAITATEGGSLKNTTALTVTAAAGTATSFVLTASTVTPVAAASFNLTTTAKDAYGNTAAGYTGAKTLTFGGASAGPAGTLPTVVNSANAVVNFGSPTAINFTSGVASVTSSRNGLARLYLAGPANLTVTDGTISTAAPLALTVALGPASRLALTAVEKSAGTLGSPCSFTCAITALGNSGVVSANVSVTDSAGNTVSNVGAYTVKVTATAGGTVTGSPMTIAETGPAVSTTRFTYTSQATGSFSGHTITAATLSGTAYTSATATVSK